MPSAFENYREYLLSVANRWMTADLRSKAGGSDLVQDTLIAAWQNSPNDELPSATTPYWLRRILKNRVHALHRHYSASKRSYILELPLEEGGAVCRHDNPEDDLLQKEEYQLLREALQRLQAREQLILTLRVAEQRTWREISTIAHMSEDAARQCHRRAIEKLRNHFFEKSGADD